MKVCVIIPTYNESKEIANIVRSIRSLNLEPIVIDDGSIDDTASIARDSGATLLINLKNEGKGACLVKGFGHAISQGFEAVITMDGDGQHKAEDIPVFLKKAETSKASVFIGNRMLKSRGMPLLRWLTNRFMSWLISKVSGQYVPDTQCGFRLFRIDVLEKIRIRTVKFEAESEIIIDAARRGYSIESVPIHTVYGGEKSQINPFVDTFRFAKFILAQMGKK